MRIYIEISDETISNNLDKPRWTPHEIKEYLKKKILMT
jgi:hypothetical protein